MPEALGGGPPIHEDGDAASVKAAVSNRARQSSSTSSYSLSQMCAGIHAKVHRFLEVEADGDVRLKAVQEQTSLSLKIFEEALERYSLDELSISYNGGKDCLVLLILYLSALHSHFSEPSTLPQKANNIPHTSTTIHSTPFAHKEQPQPAPRIPSELESVFIVSKDPFREVDDFVDESVRTYCLRMARYRKPMREAFAQYLSDHPSVRAIFVGTRRTDPHGAELQYFDPTDKGWPPFMRIHPVIDWHYVEVWTFLRALEIPYCSLYDMGYTSLGGTSDTHPNPALRRAGESVGRDLGNDEPVVYRPAYELVEDDEERLGRDWR